jgi:hypothetical protein
LVIDFGPHEAFELAECIFLSTNQGLATVRGGLTPCKPPIYFVLNLRVCVVHKFNVLGIFGEFHVGSLLLTRVMMGLNRQAQCIEWDKFQASFPLNFPHHMPHIVHGFLRFK